MQETHFKILKFLSEQTEPIREDRFPNKITSDYSHNMANEGSLIHDLRIVLAATKEWICMVKYHPNYYIISNFGKSALEKEIEKRKEENKLLLQQNEYRKQGINISRRTLRWTIMGVVVAIIIGTFTAYKLGWFSYLHFHK